VSKADKNIHKLVSHSKRNNIQQIKEAKRKTQSKTLLRATKYL